jgi:transposase-like protein
LKVMVSDGADGLVKTIRGLYPRVYHQLCSFHKATNLGLHLKDKCHRRRIILDALHVFEGKTKTEVRRRLRMFCDHWSLKEPKSVRCFLKGLE